MFSMAHILECENVLKNEFKENLRLETEMENWKQKLRKVEENSEELTKELKELKEVNHMLETLRCDLKVKNSKLEEKLAQVEEGQRFEIVTKEDVETTRIGDEFMAKVRDLESKIQELERENEDLRRNQNLWTQLDEVNRSMIEMKVESKQQQKQIDEFKKMSNANQEIVKLNEVEISNLKEKVSQLAAENAELHHKLSDKASSSGESIEIVERLTQQECLEIEAFNKGLEKTPEIGEELNESLVKIREESSVLNDKIEVKCLEYCENVSLLEERLHQVTNEKDEISRELKSILEEKRKIQDELNALKRESRMKPSEEWKNLVEQAESVLTALPTEIESFSRARDMKSAAKKFTKEVENCHQQFVNVLDKIKKDLDRGAETDDEIENLKEKIDMLSKEVEERQGYATIIEDLKAEIYNLRLNGQKENEEHASQMLALQSELESLKKQEKSSNQEEVNELNVRIQSLQLELDELRNYPAENHAEELDRLRRELTEFKVTFETKIHSLEDLFDQRSATFSK